MASLGDRLKELRKSYNMTQDDLGKLLGVTKFSISLYENNKNSPSDEMKIHIAEYFDVSLDYLMGKTDIKNHSEYNVNSSLPQRLKLLREQSGLLQKDIAEKLQITSSAYGYYEQEKTMPDALTLMKLADIFDVSIDYLMGKTNTVNTVPSNQPTDLAINPFNDLSPESIEKAKEYIAMLHLLEKSNEKNTSATDNLEILEKKA